MRKLEESQPESVGGGGQSFNLIAAQLEQKDSAIAELRSRAESAEAEAAAARQELVVSALSLQRLSWGSSLAKLTFLSTVVQYISSQVFGLLECTGNCLLQLADLQMSCPTALPPCQNTHCLCGHALYMCGVSYRDGCVHTDTPPCQVHTVLCMAYLTGRAVCARIRLHAAGSKR
jgi:hypothetical protein